MNSEKLVDYRWCMGANIPDYNGNKPYVREKHTFKDGENHPDIESHGVCPECLSKSIAYTKFVKSNKVLKSDKITKETIDDYLNEGIWKFLTDATDFEVYENEDGRKLYHYYNDNQIRITGGENGK